MARKSRQFAFVLFIIREKNVTTSNRLISPIMILILIEGVNKSEEKLLHQNVFFVAFSNPVLFLMQYFLCCK